MLLSEDEVELRLGCSRFRACFLNRLFEAHIRKELPKEQQTVSTKLIIFCHNEYFIFHVQLSAVLNIRRAGAKKLLVTFAEKPILEKRLPKNVKLNINKN